MKEKLQEYALIAEIIGGISIVASLLFVGVQINQNHQMMRAQIRSEIALALSQRMWDGGNSPYFIETGFFRDPEELSEENRLRQEQIVTAMLRMYENMHYQYKNGLFDESEFLVETQAWKGYINRKAQKSIFCENPGWYSEDFRNLLISFLETPCAGNK